MPKRGSNFELNAPVAEEDAAGADRRPRILRVAEVPHLMEFWDHEQNELNPAVVSSQSSKPVSWRCAASDDHRWTQSPNGRCGPDGTRRACPFCANRRVCPSNSLASVSPEVAKEWHPRRNGELGPDAIVATSRQEAWWLCSNGHEWQEEIGYRTRLRHPCRACRSFAFKEPELHGEWDHERNHDVDPWSIGPGSPERVWWRARACGHRFVQSVRARCEGSRMCQVCCGRQLADDNSLADTNPDLARDWDAERNLRTPSSVGAGSGYRASWRCALCEHRWTDRVVDRAQGKECPACKLRNQRERRSLAVVEPDLCLDWHPDNTVTPWDVTPGAGTVVMWRCRECSHEWRTTVASRARQGTGCGPCSRRVDVSRSLAATHPQFAAEWSKRNERGATEVSAGTSAEGYWECATCGHEWRSRVHARALLGRGCPACAKDWIASTQSIAALRPDLAAEWDDANLPLTPLMVKPGSNKHVQWICSDCGHGWRAAVAKRSTGHGCPACANRVVTRSNSLRSVAPELAREWDPLRNDKTPDEVVAGGARRYWWRCRANPAHRWETTIASRLAGTSCPECSIAPRSRQEIGLAMELATVFAFDLEDHKVRDGAGVMDVDILIRSIMVAVEFDGSYFHQGREARDSDKASRLRSEGWHVIRVREHPLEALTDDDVVVAEGAVMKQLADPVLARIRELPGAGAVRDQIDRYLTETDARAAVEARAYILALQTERARQTHTTTSPATAAPSGGA